MPTADEFFAIDIRVGTVMEAASFPEASKPSIRLTIDFGPEIGVNDRAPS
jgi:tRNA-binding protein